MRSIWREILMSLVMGMLLPGIVMNWAVEAPEQPEQTSPSHEQMEQPDLEKLTMRLRHGDQVEEMEMDAYLTGVLLAELPADFAPEAKKAQAVAARTFTSRAAVTGGKHGDGSVCDTSTCCQAYISPADYLEKGGSREAVDQARAAVEDTSGYVLTYEGQLIEATYFSCSGGITEDAVAVWGTEYPYLQSVQSPGEEGAAHYTDTEFFSREVLENKLDLSLSGAPGSWLGSVTYTPGGGVDTLVLGGKTFTGLQLRSKLGLRSTAFTLTPEGDGLTIVTRGFGHRVGMSQYGADAMALSGKTYPEILAWYYQGTTLELTKSGS